MADSIVGVTEGPTPTKNIDNSQGTVATKTVQRQRVSVRGEFGTWAYDAGTSGTKNIPATGLLLSVMAHATGSGATMTINGGTAIPIIANSAFFWLPAADLVATTLVFTGTDSWFADWLVPG